MKPHRKIAWMTWGMVLFLSFNLLLNWSPNPVESKSPPTSLQLPTPGATQSTSISASADVQLAQISEAASRFQTLAEADELFRGGRPEEAANLYRKVKPDFPPAPSTKGAEPIYEISQLDKTAQGYWQNALDAITKNQDSQIFPPLRQLTEKYPQFISGHLKLAEICKEKAEACTSNAQEGTPKNAIEVLERATELYADVPELVKAKTSVLADAGKFIEASIAARQFALVFLDYPEAPEFARLADEYLQKYLEKLKPLTAVGVASEGRRLIDSWRNRNFRDGISGVDTIKLILAGESAMGKKAAEEYKKQLTLEENPEVLNYVKGLAGRFTPLMKRDFEYEYFIVQDSELNAFALPGGKIFVNTGAILKTNSEAELAGLLAHEIAHSVLSHGFKKMVTGSVVSNLSSNLSQKVPFSDVVSEMVIKAYSRAQERQADILASRVLAKSGYAADGLRNLMEILSKQEKDATTNWQSTHPASAERVRYLENLIRSNGYNRYAYEGVKTHQVIQQKLGAS